MRILVAIDKFKESLTSVEAASIIKQGIEASKQLFDTTILPIADGGDGFASVLKHYLKTKTIKVKSVNPLYKPIVGSYEWNSISRIAIIELAVCSGIALLKGKDRNPLHTSTYGTGLLIKHAISKGAKKIILGLGGSATNDGGIGIASALGFIFLDRHGNELMPIGASLIHIHTIVPPSIKYKVSFIIATDVDNKLFGSNGASFVYAPQKGANDSQVKYLDKGLRNLSKIITSHTGISVSNNKGIGAAGGVSAMLVSYFGASLTSGIDLIIETSNFKKHIKNCDLVITGEGKVDNQSFQGKVVGTFIGYAKKYNKKVLLITGKMETIKKSKLSNIDVIELSRDSMSIQYSIKNAKKILLKRTIEYFSSF